MQAAAPALGLSVTSLSARDRASLEKALDSLATSPPDALIATEALSVQLSAELIKRATALRVPVVHFWPGTAEQGALLSYQADVHDNFPACCRLCRQNPQGRETQRSSYLSVRALRVGRKSERCAYVGTNAVANLRQPRGSSDSVNAVTDRSRSFTLDCRKGPPIWSCGCLLVGEVPPSAAGRGSGRTG